MRIAILGLAVALAAGCSTNETVKRVRGLADKACACTDAACADAVEKEYIDMVKEGQKRGSEDDRAEVAAAYSRMRDCITSARTGEKPAPATAGEEKPAGGAEEPAGGAEEPAGGADEPAGAGP